MLTRPLFVSFTFVVLIILTQWGTLGREVIDWDESTFIILADRLKDGHLPYDDVFDNKPPLIFFMLAGVMSLFGENLISIRLFGDVCILASAMCVMQIAQKLTSRTPAIMAGIIFIAMTGLHFGQHTSTELPAIALILASVLVMLCYPRHLSAILIAGVLISLATLTRSNLSIVAIFIGIYLTAYGLCFPQHRYHRWAIVPYIIGGAFPLGCFIFLYWWAGALDTFILATVTVPAVYAAEQLTWLQALQSHAAAWTTIMYRFPFWVGLFSASVLGGACVTLFLTATAVQQDVTTKRGDALLLVVFTFAVVLSILISGPAYPHYWLQVIPFACILTAPFFAFLNQKRRLFWVSCIVVGLVLGSALRATTPDLVRLLITPNALENRWKIQQAAHVIAPILTPDDDIWALENHLIYWYLGKPPISRVAAHPSNITRPSIIKPLTSAGYVASDALQRVYDSQPAFIVTASRRLPPYLPDTAYFQSYLTKNYIRFHSDNLITVYRRIGHGTP